ncbi:uncharacterized protein MAM_07524 [Metarhizium album ARSEF 1941]|uniref:HypA-like protein n=1 Tax=Metarhizium album (strain ARSEF 1941) TaxID=1081103 RepID=A0A0B2WKZ3_METAS|nr:uncharacterized protein MAM_07524 [Metarhizium album ARSEF 1941]KHN94618.1 hypothetical protein MAM_07524 [Metarhizium album ARSEF 1941]
MASASRIVVGAEDKDLWSAAQGNQGSRDEEAAAKASELLQADLTKYHVFFNTLGYHNHLVHQVLTLYSTGAPASVIQAAFDANKSYQIDRLPTHPHVVAELHTDFAAHAPKYLGRADHYPDFLRFFQDEIDKRGWQAVIGEFLCSDGPVARHMVQRLFSGIAHPMIQLGFGLEWEQPAIMAEGLAQTAVHHNPLGNFFDRVDEAVRAPGPADTDVPRRGLSDLCEKMQRENPKLASASTWRDGDGSLYDGVLGRGLEDAVALCANIRVRQHDYEERVAEAIHHNAYVAASASWKPPHIPKYDFYLMHSLNSSMFLLCLDKPCFPVSARLRILEHKMRYDVVQYVARGCPALSPSHVTNYDPGERLVRRPEDLLPRYHGIIDDGHVIKAARSLLLAQRVSRKWAGKAWIRIAQDQDWLKAHYMLLKSVEGQEPPWVRSAGFDEAWSAVPRLE